MTIVSTSLDKDTAGFSDMASNVQYAATQSIGSGFTIDEAPLHVGRERDSGRRSLLPAS